MTTLNLKIHGLCGLVPSSAVPTTPTQQPFPIRRMRVLVLDAATLAGGQICAHHPRLAVGNGGSSPPVSLEGHKITIEGLDSTSQRINLLTPGFWDVAQIDQITSASFRVADGFLTDTPSIAGLVASLRLTAGEVVGIEPLTREQVFASGYRKNFAQVVHMRLPLNGPGKIHLTRFGASTPEHSIDLVPDSQDSVDVELSNLCDPSPSVLGTGEVEGAEGTDFVAFYGLLHKYDGPLFVPKVASKSSRRYPGEIQGGASTVESGCIPCLYSDHPDA